MSTQTTVARRKIYSALSKMTERYQFAPLDEGPSRDGRVMPVNQVLWALNYVLNGNCLISGEPGGGKTTGAKILSTMLSGIPYDTFDAFEIRGHPQKYEEKIVGRLDFGALNGGSERVIWQGSFGLPVLLLDEGNRLSYDSQDVILQGLETRRWNYLNESLYVGDGPAYITMNQRTGHTNNGFLPAFRDRIHIITDVGIHTAMDVTRYGDAKRNVRKELCDPEFTTCVQQSLARGFKEFRKTLDTRATSSKSRLTPSEIEAIQGEIQDMDSYGADNSPALFLMAFSAEINFSNKYGIKRSTDPISDDTHDRVYAGVCVHNSFSPRSAMAAADFSRALAWFMGDSELHLDHIRFILPHIIAHKASFTDDYRNAHGHDTRKNAEDLHLAKALVHEVHKRYIESIQPMKNLIARIQEGRAKPSEMDETKHDHPLIKDLIRQAKAPETAFYEKFLKSAA